jgi:NAD(P)-dependent dehydrogenase (short-subunit alcohol dehydrogenase family)
MDPQLPRKRAFVSGSTAGIGFAAAARLDLEGAFVVIDGRPAHDDSRVRFRYHDRTERGATVAQALDGWGDRELWHDGAACRTPCPASPFMSLHEAITLGIPLAAGFRKFSSCRSAPKPGCRCYSSGPCADVASIDPGPIADSIRLQAPAGG